MSSSTADDAPAFTPDAVGLAHTELLLSGAYGLDGFMTAKESAAVREHGRLPDGRKWPETVVLAVPEEHRAAESLLHTDPEGAPLARRKVTDRWREAGRTHLAGPVQQVRPPVHGVLRHRRLTPEQAAAQRIDPSGPLLVVVADRTPHYTALGGIRRAAARLAERHGTTAPPEILVLVDIPFTDARMLRVVEAALTELRAGEAPPPHVSCVALTLPRPPRARPGAAPGGGWGPPPRGGASPPGGGV
jgi:sulfate adenylyltransferase